MLEKIAYHRTTILKNTFSIILLILILAVEGCFNFLTFEFKIDRLLSLGFWTSVGFKVLLLVLVKVWVMSIFIDVALRLSSNEAATKVSGYEISASIIFKGPRSSVAGFIGSITEELYGGFSNVVPSKVELSAAREIVRAVTIA